MLGFTDVEPFRRALKAGLIPAPDEYWQGHPVWHRKALEQRYGSGAFDDSRSGETELMKKIEAAF